ncbi:hypothetical protein DNTS_030313 [Danionella cerebrum]|nr:hypothetical protein DNTS_030313 [Danionella translucida]
MLSGSKVEGKNCFIECKGQKKVLRTLFQAGLLPTQPVIHHHPPADSCQAFARTSKDISHRSLSPWRTRTVVNPDLYPNKYGEAECLCDGCIINGVENHSYNSVPVVRTHLFLKRIPCLRQPGKYSWAFEYVPVKVACTCVVPVQ